MSSVINFVNQCVTFICGIGCFVLNSWCIIVVIVFEMQPCTKWHHPIASCSQINLACVVLSYLDGLCSYKRIMFSINILQTNGGVNRCYLFSHGCNYDMLLFVDFSATEEVILCNSGYFSCILHNGHVLLD